jgi:hypothetical protein
MSEPLPPYITREQVSERLHLIFPEGTPNRTYCTRDLAASTVFTALYIGAVEGMGRYLGPVHVYRMTEEQAAKPSDEVRQSYAAAVLKRAGQIPGKRWYADNTREPIRDETLRDGLVAVGAVSRREDLATTSGAPRYALKAEFAELFAPTLQGEDLEKAIGLFQANHLSKGALARVSIMLSGAAGSAAGVLVTFPSGETRQLAPGPSSIIAQAVVEVFAKRFLEQPAVLWLSESGNKVVMRDDQIATALGLNIEADKNLPDLILADLKGGAALLVFVEVVATDGAIHERRKEAIYAITDSAGFDRGQIAFVTAYQDRESAGFRKTVSQLAWGSFAWFVSEPDQLLVMHDGAEAHCSLRALLGK